MSQLSNRVEKLERKFIEQSLIAAEKNPEKSSSFSTEESYEEEVVENYKKKDLVEEITSPATDSSSNWFSEDWLLKIGAILLLLSFSWFVRYAFMNDWVSELNRIYIGIVSGISLMLYGWSQLAKIDRENRGTVFALLGSSVVILSMFAAREMYSLFTPTISLLVMFLSVLFISYLGVRYKNSILYLVGFALAVISPFLLNIESPNYVNLFLYLLGICFGALWIDVLTKNSNMSIAALLAYTLYSLPHILGIVYSSNNQLILFAYIFTGIFLLIGIINFVRKSEYLEANSILLYGSALLLLAWIVRIGGNIEKISILIWMFIFFGAGFLVYYFTRKNNILLMYIGIAIAFLAAFTTLHYSGDVLVIAYIIEIFLLSLLMFELFGDLKVTRLTSSLFVLPVLMSFKNITSKDWIIGIIHNSSLILVLLGSSIFIIGLFFSFKKLRYSKNKLDFSLNKNYAQIFIIVGSLYFYVLLWLSLHSMMLDQNATIISLIIYIIIGLTIYFYGVFSANKNFELYGKIMLILVLIRLFVIDVWVMEFIGRIITFFVVGVLLMVTTFLKKKENETLI